MANRRLLGDPGDAGRGASAAAAPDRARRNPFHGLFGVNLLDAPPACARAEVPARLYVPTLPRNCR